MSETILEHDQLKGAAMAAPAADRDSDQPVSGSSDKEPDITDTTTILQGAAAIVGKAAWSVNRMDARNDVIAAYEHARRLRDEREAEQARELAHLAEWNKQMTMVGGVAMTNAEAQDARQRLIENDETYARWAVKHGYIAEDEKDDFKKAIRRKKDLEDKRGRGTISAAEDQEEAALDRSRPGKAAEAATAQDFQQRGIAPNASGAALSTKESVQRSSPTALDDYALFQAEAQKPVNTAQQPSQLARSVQATGLDL